ncbi:tubulin/FtsZ family protein [Chloroflexota bacterium]
MKLVVIGLGQCGGRIADEFSKLNKKAGRQRGIEIVTDTFAVNTDAADLEGLTSIKRDHQHRILIGGRKTGGHGVGKVNELGAEVAKADADKVIDAIRTTKRFYETDAFLLIASAGGGTGSGSLPVVTQHVKERYQDKPVLAAVVLPFEHEETTEERTICNTATCLKSTYAMADTVILIDNQRYIRKDSSLRNNLQKINALIAEPFYSILCAGEEKNAKNIGGKLLDAGDIMQTLVGWTVLGYGTTQLPLFRLPGKWGRDFKKKGDEVQNGLQAMDAAMSELSLNCNPADARRALYLISAPTKDINVNLVKELGDYMRGITPHAVIRNGDYPRQRGLLEVSVILSELSDVEKVREYYSQSTVLIPEMKKRQEETEDSLEELEDASVSVPSLL